MSDDTSKAVFNVGIDLGTADSEVYVLFVRTGPGDKDAHILSTHDSIAEAVAAARAYEKTAVS